MFLGDFASCEDYASENELHEQLEDINIYTPPVLPIKFNYLNFKNFFS